MEKVEIKLKDSLVERGLGFYDPISKKDIKHEKGKTLIVERTDFVNVKIQTGEILVVNANPKTEEKAKEK